MTKSPLLPIAIAFACGIAIAPHFYLTAYERLAALFACIFFSAALAYFHRNIAALTLAWMGFLLAGTILAALERLAPPPDHIESLVRTGEIDITKPIAAVGHIRVPSQARPGSYVFDVELAGVEQGAVSSRARGTIRVYYYPKNQDEPPLRLQYGENISLELRDLRAPRNYGNPGVYDYEAAMQRQGIAYTSLIRDRGRDVRIQPGFSGSRWRRITFQVREAMLSSIEQLFPSKPKEQSILKAILLGDDNWLSEGTEEAFQQSGTYHVLVISGWNVAVFAGPLLLLLAWLRLPNWLSSAIVFCTVVSFALIAQSQIPIVRASVMFLVFLVARLFFRQRELLNSLAAAALLLLILNPLDLFDWGFQLSFIAVLTLALIALPASEWKLAPFRIALRELEDSKSDHRHKPKQIQFRTDLRAIFAACEPWLTTNQGKPSTLRKALQSSIWLFFLAAETLLFTTMMQMGYSLVTAQYFHRLTWSGIVGNILILPIASGIVIFGMVLIPLGYSLPGLAKLFAPLLGFLCIAIENVAKFAASWHGLNLRVPTPPAWLSLGFLVFAAATALLLARRSNYGLLTAAGLALWCALISLPRTENVCQRGMLELTAIDVGQGDSLLVCFPRGTTMLVDAGGAIPIPGSPVRRQDIGETVVSTYLWQRGISRLDYVVLSHDHFDHMGGLEAVFDNFRVGEFWMGPDAADRNMNWLRRRAARAGANVVWPVRSTWGHPAKEIDGVRLEVLSPPENWSPRKVSNDDSIVLRLTYGNRSILLAGDIESRMERALVASEGDFRSDILKVAHHGSRTSTTAAFLERVNPAISIVSVGAYGRFGHPNEQVIERLSSGRRALYTTPHSGAIRVLTDGNKIQVDAFNDEKKGWPDFLAKPGAELQAQLR